MARGRALIPVGVLAGVLALSGGVGVIVHGSAGTPPAVPSASNSTALPATLVQAARATLGHRSLVLSQDADQAHDGFDFHLRGVADSATGNYSLRMVVGTPADGGRELPTETRFVDGVAYMQGTSSLTVLDDTAIKAEPGKTWQGLRVPPADVLGANPVAALRLALGPAPDWSARSAPESAGVVRYTLDASKPDLGEVQQFDFDVRGGEIVRIASRTKLPDLPNCPGLPKEVLQKQDQAEDGEAINIRGSEQPAQIAAPPAAQVEFMPGDFSTIPTPEPLTCADFSGGGSAGGLWISTAPTPDPIPELPRRLATYSGPAEPSPSAVAR